MPLLAQAARGPVDYWPLLVLLFSVALIIVLITVLRVHAFIALVLAAVFAGLLTPKGKLPGETVQTQTITNALMVAQTNAVGALVVAPAEADGPPGGLQSAHVRITLPGQKTQSHYIQAVELTTTELGFMAGKVAVVIALASLIGLCLMESGAADKVVRRFLAVFGERRAGVALLTSGYILSIPIFFDTFFMLLLPLARALALRTGKNYLLYVLAICCCGTVTHSLCVPHPGPLAMADALKLDAGLTMMAGLVFGLPAVAASWLVAQWLNRRVPVPLRETPGASAADLRAIADKPESELPSFFWSIVPVLLPLLLISLASTFAALPAMKMATPALFTLVEFAGNRNVALFVGVIVALAVLMRQRGLDLAGVARLFAPALETAGVIILITSAGGAFGLMLSHAGVGKTLQALVQGENINLILLSWLVATVIRVAQGSATVAMLTTAGMIYPIMTSAPLPYHPLYLFMAIGFGAMTLSWMNDSGFWVVGRLSGFTEKETLKTWTVVVTVNSVAGLLTCLLFSWLLPLK
jgi:GntP family gluconate:H+ symporter